MKQIKKIIISAIASFIIFSGTAFAISPRDIFLNYGGGIQKGDVVATIATGAPWSSFSNKGGWVAPSIMAEVEFAQPIGSVPFTFGGYLNFDFRGTPDGYYGYYDAWGKMHPYDNGYYYYDNTVYSHIVLRSGGSATYHVAIPPVEGLDLNVSMKMGFCLDFSNWYPNKVGSSFDFGFSFGASYFFNDTVGIKAVLGYPYGSVGAVFKL